MKRSFILLFMILALIVSSFAFVACGGGANTRSDSNDGNSFSESNFDNESPKESLKESISQSEQPIESVNESKSESESESESIKESVPAEEIYTITFDSAGGTSVPSQKVLNGKKIKKPDAPTKVGYTFTGWFVADDEWNFLAYTVTDDMTLTAGWAANTYVISFNVDGGKSLADLNVTYNSAFVLPVPEKENHVFLGWELGGEAFENGIYTKTESITLTAKWDILKYTIKFENADVEAMKVAYDDSSYVLPIPKREGMTFRYWALNGEKFDGGVLLTKDITLTAEWEGVNNTFDFTVSGSEVTITALHTDLTDIIIPASINGNPVVSVKEGVFANNSSITSVVFDGTFENYTEKMFAGCSSLKSLTISGVFDKALWWLFGDSASSVPASFTEISFALNSNYIDGSMFKNWGWLAEHTITYVIQYGVTKINDIQFAGWDGLQSVTIPDSVESIGVGAFQNCSLICVEIPDGVTSIGDVAFQNCVILTSVTIPDSVTSIWNSTFSGCAESLYTKAGGIIYVDNWAVDVVNDTIVSAIIKPGTRGVANSVFNGCRNLTSVTIPDSVATIGERAFSYCDSLTSVEIPSSVTSIEREAFAYCGSLTSVIIPDSVTSIERYAFSYCSSLTSVTIPSNVSSIGYMAFSDCSSLTSVTFNGTMAQWKSIKGDFSWRDYSKITIIKCSDGDINL